MLATFRPEKGYIKPETLRNRMTLLVNSFFSQHLAKVIFTLNDLNKHLFLFSPS